jgi:hypothetical protein
MDLIEIDNVNPKAPKTSVGSSEYSTITQVQRPNLGGYHDLLAMAADNFADDLLRSSASVNFGCINEIDAHLYRLIEGI